MLRPGRRQGNGSSGSLEVAGTARMILSPWWGRAIREGKCWEPHGQRGTKSESTWGRTQPHIRRLCKSIKTYGKNEIMGPYKKTAFRKMENNLRGLA